MTVREAKNDTGSHFPTWKGSRWGSDGSVQMERVVSQQRSTAQKDYLLVKGEGEMKRLGVGKSRTP